jgi:hypothetical protein
MNIANRSFQFYLSGFGKTGLFSWRNDMESRVSFAAGVLALFTGWLGGELVDRLSVGVDEGAHVDAPSSLSTRRIRA